MGPSDRNVLEVQGLTVRFDTSERSVVAVKDLGFHVRAGEVLAIVGESGSGKSVTSLSVMRLIEHGGGTIASGKISFTRRNGGKLDLAKAADSVMRTIRGGEISMIFQEPMTSLNPVFSVGTQVAEAVMLHQGLSHAEAEAEALRMLELVRIPEAKQILKRYPHQLSGGMRQRVMIAMALSCKPSLLIADEPTTALDVTIQAQILQLIRQLQEEMGMAVIFITHDMGVVAEVADRVLVMYHGEAVEEGTCEQIFHNPRHPYTQSLLAAVPRLGSMRGTDEPAPFPLLRITDPEAEQLGTADMDETPVDMPEPAASVPSVSDGPVLSVDNLITRFDVETGFWGKVKRRVHAVEQVSFNLYPGETLGLVGESGCGKTTTGRSIIKLYNITGGNVFFKGIRIAAGKRGYENAIAKAKADYKAAVKEHPDQEAQLKAALAAKGDAASVTYGDAPSIELPAGATLADLEAALSISDDFTYVVKSGADAVTGATTPLTAEMTLRLFTGDSPVANGVFAIKLKEETPATTTTTASPTTAATSPTSGTADVPATGGGLPWPALLLLPAAGLALALAAGRKRAAR